MQCGAEPKPMKWEVGDYSWNAKAGKQPGPASLKDLRFPLRFFLFNSRDRHRLLRLAKHELAVDCLDCAVDKDALRFGVAACASRQPGELFPHVHRRYSTPEPQLCLKSPETAQGGC